MCPTRKPCAALRSVLPAHPQPQPQLSLVRVGRRHYQEVGGADVRVRVVEVLRVGHIRDLSGEGGLEALRDRERLGKAHVAHVDGISLQHVPATVAKSAGLRNGKGRGTILLSQTLGSGPGIAHAIRHTA